MAIVITRYFETAETAARAKRNLIARGFPPNDLRIIDDADAVSDTLAAASVSKTSAGAYKKKLAAGGAVLLAKATFYPLCAAQLVRDQTAELGAADMGKTVEEVEVAEPKGRPLPILVNHPRLMTRMRDPENPSYHMANWPIPLISRRVPKDDFAFPRHARMANWPIPLISKRKPGDAFAFPRHARMASFPIPLISKRKPADRFAFPRHARMADRILPLSSRRTPSKGT